MKRVLVVEDDQSIAKALALRLKSIGCQANIANDAVTAATVARRCNPDVAVLDISMPGGDGFVVAERLRRQNDNLPIVFITANAQPELRERAMEMGATAFFSKPYVADELMNAIVAA